jgi:hypothetical protein
VRKRPKTPIKNGHLRCQVLQSSISFQFPQIPTYKFWLQHVFFPSFFHSNKPLPLIPPAQAASVFVAFSRLPSLHRSLKPSLHTLCTGLSKNLNIRRCPVLISAVMFT